ncbi:MAG: cytochrome c3 family protein [Woeseiaceae bacterium]
MSISVLEALQPAKKPALLGLVAVLGLLAGVWVHGKYYSDRSPVQPIEFSHKVHATDNEIPCQHCHIYAATTPVAGVPSVSKCVGCHKSLPDVREQPEILKLNAYWEKREPIPWIKVHDVPDFVHFTHKRHIKADVECQECHGPVETMDRVTRVATLRMPWCVDCHTEKDVEHGRDCWTCHK